MLVNQIDNLLDKTACWLLERDAVLFTCAEKGYDVAAVSNNRMSSRVSFVLACNHPYKNKVEGECASTRYDISKQIFCRFLWQARATWDLAKELIHHQRADVEASPKVQYARALTRQMLIHCVVGIPAVSEFIIVSSYVTKSAARLHACL